MGVFPDFGAVGGRDLILQVLGALLTVVLIFAVLMLLVSAIVWAIAAVHGNYQGASRGRIGVLVALGAAALAGAGVALTGLVELPDQRRHHHLTPTSPLLILGLAPPSGCWGRALVGCGGGRGGDRT